MKKAEMFGEWFRRMRECRGLSVREFAKRLDVSSAYVSQVERGRSAAFVLEKLPIIAKILDINLLELEARSASARLQVPVSRSLVASENGVRIMGLLIRLVRLLDELGGDESRRIAYEQLGQMVKTLEQRKNKWKPKCPECKCPNVEWCIGHNGVSFISYHRCMKCRTEWPQENAV